MERGGGGNRTREYLRLRDLLRWIAGHIVALHSTNCYVTPVLPRAESFAPPVACSLSKVDPMYLAFVSKMASLAIVFLGDNIFL